MTVVTTADNTSRFPSVLLPCRSTCFDDVDFFVTLLKAVEADACIDTAARFLSGASNVRVIEYCCCGDASFSPPAVLRLLS